MKRYLSIILILVLLITPMTNVMGVSAVVYSTADYDDVISTLISTAETYETNFNNVQERQGIFTQLYQARQIFHYSTYLYAAAYSAENDEKYRAVIGSSLRSLAVNLSDMIVTYNVSYFVKDGEYIGTKFAQKGSKIIELEKLETVSDEDIKNACSAIESWCLTIARQYVVSTLEAYAASVNTNDSENAKEEYGSLCAELYKGMQYGRTCITDAETLLGFNGEKSLDMSKYKLKKATILRRIEYDIEKYADIFSVGQISVVADKNIENAIHIDPTKSIIENMADVYVESDASSPDYGVISIEKDPKLSLAYIGALATSATYTPFESYVGDARFMAALDSLCADQETATLLNNYYNSLKLYKKPLYFRNLNAVGNPEGQAELKTIEEIFTLIKSGAAGSLCTVGGNLCVNTNTGDWVYTTEQLDSSLLYTLKSSLQEAEQQESSLGDAEQEDDSEVEEFNGTYAVDPKPDYTVSDHKAQINEVSTTVYKKLHAAGYSDAAICGILGNIVQECNYDINDKTGQYWGLCQWGNESFPNFHEEWNTKYYNNLENQVDYLIQTLNKGYTDVRDAIKNESDPTKACAVFCAEYEKCTVSGTPTKVDAEYNDKMYQGLANRLYVSKQFYEHFLDELKESAGESTALNNIGNKLNSFLSNIGMFGIKTVYASPTEEDLGDIDEEEDLGDIDEEEDLGDITDDTNEDLETNTDTNTGSSTEVSGGTENEQTETEDVVEEVTDVPSVDTDVTNTEDAPTVEDSADKIVTDYSSKQKDFKDAISASRIISDESRLNGPSLLFGSVCQRDIDNMTTAIYSNVLNGAGNYNIENMDSEYLYINALGDIVTASDLVIFPGILNPLLYADGIAYNPYTVAFMNSYPANIRNAAYYMLSSKSDVGKYCLFLDTPEGNEADAISGYNEDEDCSYVLSNGTYEFALLNSTTGVKSTQTLLSKPIFNKFIYGDFEKSPTFRLQKYLFCYNIDRKSDVNSYIPLIENASIYANNKQVFPYDFTTDTDSSISKIIANNMYQYLTTDFITKEVGNQGKLNDNWILHYILISGYEGSADISSYKNNLDISYDGYTMSNSSRVIKQVVDFSEKLIDSISSVNCVLGIQNSYEDVLLGKIVTLIRNYWIIFYILFLFVVLIAVMRAKKDLLQSGFLIIACSIAAYAFVYFVPVYLPMLYNLAVNNVSDRVAYEVLLQNNEYNEGTADNIVDVDDEGKLKYNTSSITLYRMPSAQLESYYNNLGISLRDATGGKAYVLDQYAGFFLEGDSLKMSTDILFGTLSIKEDPSTGQLHAYKTTSNNVDYYIPYYQIVDSLVDKMNRITNVYDVNHSTTKLKNGSRANNFRTYTYFNSPIFVDPENFSADLQLDVTGWNQEEIEDYAFKQKTIAEALRSEFGENADWLGLYDILVTNALKEGSNFQNTLWFNTMCDVGYYKDTGNGWEADEDNMNALINYVNYQTRNFIYDIHDYIGDISDEAILEIVALRAVVALTQEASDFTHWMYPFSVNYPEFSLGDVQVSTFVEKYSDYVKNDYSIVKYINDKYGWFNLIVFDLVSILLFIVTWLVKILTTLFYVLLLVVLLIRMFGDGEYKVVVKGFLKCSIIIMFILLLQVMSIALGSKLVGNVISIYAVLAFSILALYLLIIVITSVLFNFADFGNAALNAKASGVTSMMQNMKNININTTNLHRIRPERNPAIVLPQAKLSKYDFDVDTDTQYDMQIRSNTDISNSITEELEEPELEFDTDDDVVIETKDYEF